MITLQRSHQFPTSHSQENDSHMASGLGTGAQLAVFLHDGGGSKLESDCREFLRRSSFRGPMIPVNFSKETCPGEGG